MAYVNYKKLEAEVDALALQYRELAQKDMLTHREKKERTDCIEEISRRLLNYARNQNRLAGIYKESDNDADGVELWKIIKRTLEIYTQNDKDTYFKLFCAYYIKRKPTIKQSYLSENQAARGELSIDGEENVENLKKAEEAKGEREDNKNPADQMDMWDEILDLTRQEALKKSLQAARYMQGYWTIQFIENQIGRKQAQIWEIYILLLFFLANERLYAKHGELMDLMAQEFNLKRRAWSNHYKETFDDICRYLRHLRVLK